ncbi:5'-methylthioadenosine/S-adenosylhomocysteine nucleosidase [Sinobacterium norvegicum]|uniref:5'-methylthioadenosine/S-adenosylhomocysteine nucleosidase n=1 Tax=Sinobacterium norvegicum TaxID=1641715 RepID=A0ABN8EG68_9GAMM|nr:hypothetical protein [Sinobacterium norvegicum]CAH0991415.1 5'-methylthioadenosine/S-adenosylhomocysteine nucleosidase [Sinobacterium norvegicum]
MIKKPTIALIFAMYAEAQPLIEALAASPKAFDTPLPMALFTADTAGAEVLIAVNGTDPVYGVDRIATEAAAVTAFVVLQQFKPDYLISAGSCGAVNPELRVADVLWVDKPVCFHDHRIPLGDFEPFGVGRYPVYFDADLAQTLALNSACLSSGNSLDVSDADLLQLEKIGSDIKEMEAAAIARLCQDFNIPFLAIKAVSNPVRQDHDTGEVFERNLSLAVTALTEKLQQLLPLLSACYDKNHPPAR